MTGGLKSDDWNPRSCARSGAGRSRAVRIPFDASQTMKLAIADPASGVAAIATAVAIYGTTRA